MKLFIDGLFLGWQRFGGISKVWEEYLCRLANYDVEINLLRPFFSQNNTLKSLDLKCSGINYLSDFFYRPKRISQKVELRALLLNKLYKVHDFDIFHSTYYTTLNNNKIKKVVTVHDMIPELILPKGKWRDLVVRYKKEVIHNSDIIFAVSHNTKKDILRTYKDIDDDKVIVIYNGVKHSLEYPLYNIDELNKKYNLDLGNNEYFLFVGSPNIPYKNFKLILELFKEKPRIKKYKIIVIGDNFSKKTTEFIKEYDLLNNFINLNHVTDLELKSIYKNVKGLIYPSLYEGFGLPILEAMSNGCPVLCSNVSSIPEVAGDAGIFFNPTLVDSLYDAIKRLDTENIESLKNKGKENIKKFDWDRSVEKMYNTYIK